MSSTTASQHGVWLAVIMLSSVCAAVAAGVLFYALGAEPTGVVAGAGGAFVATATLGMAAYRFMNERPDTESS